MMNTQIKFNALTHDMCAIHISASGRDWGNNANNLNLFSLVWTLSYFLYTYNCTLELSYCLILYCFLFCLVIMELKQSEILSDSAISFCQSKSLCLGIIGGSGERNILCVCLPHTVEQLKGTFDPLYLLTFVLV